MPTTCNGLRCHGIVVSTSETSIPDNETPVNQIAITRTASAKTHPADETLAFGKVFSDHMFLMNYEDGKGWHNPRIEPYAPFTMDPACCVLHYGQAIFDGLKAFRGPDGNGPPLPPPRPRPPPQPLGALSVHPGTRSRHGRGIDPRAG